MEKIGNDKVTFEDADEVYFKTKQLWPYMSWYNDDTKQISIIESIKGLVKGQN